MVAYKDGRYKLTSRSNVDPRPSRRNAHLVPKAVIPDVLLGRRTSLPLPICFFYSGKTISHPTIWRRFCAEHAQLRIVPVALATK